MRTLYHSDSYIVILPSGLIKSKYSAPAIDRYSGDHFIANRAYALSLVPLDRIFILSSLHGLVKSTHQLNPYDSYYTRTSPVTRESIAEQITKMGLADKKAIILGNSLTYDLLRGQFKRDRWVSAMLNKKAGEK